MQHSYPFLTGNFFRSFFFSWICKLTCYCVICFAVLKSLSAALSLTLILNKVTWRYKRQYLLRKFSAISLTYNMSVICCSSSKDKTFWKYIDLLETCFDRTFMFYMITFWNSNGFQQYANKSDLRKQESVQSEMFWWKRISGFANNIWIQCNISLNREMIN